jgi:hypothetical protein
LLVTQKRHRAQRAHRSRCISPVGATRWSTGSGRCPPASARLSPHVRDPNHDRRLPLWP